MVERLFLAVPWGCLRFVIVVFPDHTHLLFLSEASKIERKNNHGNFTIAEFDAVYPLRPIRHMDTHLEES